MKIQLWALGKDHDAAIKDAVEDFSGRLARYYPAEWKIFPAPRNASAFSESELRKKESEMILNAVQKNDFLVALEERGKQFSSVELSQFIQARANESTKTLVFLIGGAFGLHELVLDRANFKWSLSNLTFPHQLVRLILAEQLYRSCSILRGEKYHHS